VICPAIPEKLTQYHDPASLIEFSSCCKPSNSPAQEKKANFPRGDCQPEAPLRSQESTSMKIAQFFPISQLQDQFTPILDSFDMRWNWVR
jgi:hypothetical protein